MGGTNESIIVGGKKFGPSGALDTLYLQVPETEEETSFDAYCARCGVIVGNLASNIFTYTVRVFPPHILPPHTLANLDTVDLLTACAYIIYSCPHEKYSAHQEAFRKLFVAIACVKNLERSS